MLRVILNQLKVKAENMLVEEQAGFRPGRSTVEQSSVVESSYINIYNTSAICFIDFKKSFNRLWFAGLWQVLRNSNVDEGLAQAIQALYENSCSALLLNSQPG